MSLWTSAKEFFHFSVPVTVDEGVIKVPAFEIPLVEGLPAPSVESVKGTIAVEVEPETKVAVVKVALKKKKPVRKPAKVVKKKR